MMLRVFCVYFFVNDTATTEIYPYSHTLSLHDALPISDAARHLRLSRRTLRSRDHARDGIAGLARRDDRARIWRGGAQLRQLWPDRARGRARRFGLSLGLFGAKLAPDAPAPHLWQRGAERSEEHKS